MPDHRDFRDVCFGIFSDSAAASGIEIFYGARNWRNAGHTDNAGIGIRK